MKDKFLLIAFYSQMDKHYTHDVQDEHQDYIVYHLKSVILYRSKSYQMKRRKVAVADVIRIEIKKQSNCRENKN